MREEIAEIERLRKVEAALTGRDEWVLVRLRRIEGYEDVHPELVAEDAIGDKWPEYETLTKDAPLACKPSITDAHGPGSPQQPGSGAWLSISTHPRNQNLVLLTDGRKQWTGYYGGANSGWRTSDTSSMWPEPTHWMPLPPLPNTK